MTEITTCPVEAVFGGGDSEHYPCTRADGHEGPHSFEGLNPPSAADLAGRLTGDDRFLLAEARRIAPLMRHSGHVRRDVLAAELLDRLADLAERLAAGRTDDHG